MSSPATATAVEILQDTGSATTGNVVEGNYIGTDSTGSRTPTAF